MNGHDCEDFDDRQSRAPYFYTPPDFQHGHYEDARENYTPSSFNLASTQNIEPPESSLFDAFEQPQPTPITLRGFESMPDPYDSSQMASKPAWPFAPGYFENTDLHGQIQSRRSASLNQARPLVLTQDQRYLSSTEEYDSSSAQGNFSIGEEFPQSSHTFASSIEQSCLLTNGSPSYQQEIEHTGDSFIPQEYKRIPPQNNVEFQAQEKNYERTPNCTQNGHSSISSSSIQRPDEIAENPIHIGPLNDRYEGERPSSVQAPKKGQKGKTSHARVILGADGKPKGSVRFVRGHMEHQEVNDNTWKSAIYHEELRDKLIAEASLLGEYGQLPPNVLSFENLLIFSDHPRERGIAANDVTSFLPSQKAWGPDRDLHWPNIKDNVLHRFERKGYPIPDYQPEVWYYEGKVVLDSDNHAILNYEVLPATLSSELSGRDIEAIKRLDLRIGRKDFRARMPSTIFTKDKNKPQSTKPLHTLSAIGMRTTRFRKENGLISWTEREGGDNIRVIC